MASTTGATTPTATLHRFHSAVNSGDRDTIARAIDEFVAPDVLFHAPVPMGATGAEALKQVWDVLLRAFPDIQVTVEETVAEGDRVVSRNTVTGTHRGEYQGLPPTGRPVSYSEIFIFRFAGGQIAEIRGVVDVLAQLRQLGAVPS
ncbi:ester cyclase [Streptomyces sp. NPDC006733]|uniref:ester cyclase n=1 Tax=Streptomyces sp. NPDC006733 TaxID=3155460 RepID=UPI0033FEF7C1